MGNQIKAIIGIIMISIVILCGCENMGSSYVNVHMGSAELSGNIATKDDDIEVMSHGYTISSESVYFDVDNGDEIVEYTPGQLPYYTLITMQSGHKGVVDSDGKIIIMPNYAMIIEELEFADAKKGEDTVTFLLVDDDDNLSTYACVWPDNVEKRKGVAERQEDDKKAMPLSDFCVSGEPGVEVYEDFIRTNEFYDGFYSVEEIRLALIFIDNDNIPELVAIAGNSMRSLVKIWTIDDDGKPEEMIMFTGFYGSFRYAERSSVIEMVYGNQGVFTSYYFRVDQDEIRYLGAALEDGSRLPYSDENIEYQIDITLPDDLLIEVENNSRYFRDNGDPRYDHEITEGIFVNKDEYEEYCYGLLVECRSVSYE